MKSQSKNAKFLVLFTGTVSLTRLSDVERNHSESYFTVINLLLISQTRILTYMTILYALQGRSQEMCNVEAQHIFSVKITCFS